FEDFFDMLQDADTRPFTTGVLRGDFGSVEPETVKKFAGAYPSDPEVVLKKLEDAFIEKTSYDIPRYIAGAITYNVLMNTADPRDLLEHDVSYDALRSEENTRMFCNEYVYRSIEAIHAAEPHEQTPPVAGASVYDQRHKHNYTGVASVIRENGELKIPMTFVDYTRTTLYDDLRLTGLLGGELNAYGTHHRATTIGWSRNS
ncbi:MAG: hypothetical protein SXQ77_00700, partial [Halobacteria archaeon]|nr:hypothetical protein [Halobacteria archaeon]